jgi:hypothetical protein
MEILVLIIAPHRGREQDNGIALVAKNQHIQMAA